MAPEVLIFDILAVIAVIAGIGVVVSRNPVHSAVALVVTFVNLAGIYVMLRAEFLAAVQIIVYTGAILVLVLFVIMLVDMDDLPDFHGGQPLQRVASLLIGLILLAEIAAAVLTERSSASPAHGTKRPLLRPAAMFRSSGSSSTRATSCRSRPSRSCCLSERSAHW